MLHWEVDLGLAKGLYSCRLQKANRFVVRGPEIKAMQPKRSSSDKRMMVSYYTVS